VITLTPSADPNWCHVSCEAIATIPRPEYEGFRPLRSHDVQRRGTSTICSISAPFGWRSYALSSANLPVKTVPSGCANLTEARCRSAAGVFGVRPRNVLSLAKSAERSAMVIAAPPLGYNAALIGSFESAAVCGLSSPGSNLVAVVFIPTA
jgi:hypothetical protein